MKRTTMTPVRTLALLLVLVCAREIEAAPILSVTGINDVPLVLTSDQAAAVAFQLSADQTDMAVNAALECFGCQGLAWLSSGLDVGFDSSKFIALGAVGTGPLFTGIDLVAGTYFLTISNTQGALFWHGTSSPVVSSNGAASQLVLFKADTAVNIAPASRFDVYTAGSLLYAIESTEPVVTAEPGTAMLLFGALLGVAVVRWRRRKQDGNPSAFLAHPLVRSSALR